MSHSNKKGMLTISVNVIALILLHKKIRAPVEFLRNTNLIVPNTDDCQNLASESKRNQDQFLTAFSIALTYNLIMAIFDYYKRWLCQVDNAVGTEPPTKSNFSQQTNPKILIKNVSQKYFKQFSVFETKRRNNQE